jgi:lipoyl(octanoyl) transferase
MHGLALNANTNLKYFENIIPCGIEGKDVTSIERETNKKVDIADIEKKLINNLSEVFEFKILDDEI